MSRTKGEDIKKYFFEGRDMTAPDIYKYMVSYKLDEGFNEGSVRTKLESGIKPKTLIYGSEDAVTLPQLWKVALNALPVRGIG